MASTIRRLGLFRELEPRATGAPSIHDAVGAGPGGERQRRATFYLATASHVVAVMEMLPDVIDGEQVFLSGGYQSDGDWFWRSDLAHYVLKYNLTLPDDFITHAESFMWSPGVLSGDELLACSRAIGDHLSAQQGQPRPDDRGSPSGTGGRIGTSGDQPG